MSHCEPRCDTDPSSVTGCSLSKVRTYELEANYCWADVGGDSCGAVGGKWLGLCRRHADEIIPSRAA